MLLFNQDQKGFRFMPAEALQSAEEADPRVDLEWMRIRYERDLNKRWDLTQGLRGYTL